MALVVLGSAAVFFLARPFWEAPEEQQEQLDGTVPEMPGGSEGGQTPEPLSSLDVVEHASSRGTSQPGQTAAPALHAFVIPPPHPLPVRLNTLHSVRLSPLAALPAPTASAHDDRG